MLQPILARYDLPAIMEIESLGSAGGFSGANLWKIHTSSETFCLRRWPKSHPDSKQLRWIHRVVIHARNNDCPFVAAPISTRSGETYVTHNDFLWELSPWMPGVANFSKSASEARLANMMHGLAHFHLASAQVSLDFRQSTNLHSRIEQLQELPSLLEKIRIHRSQQPQLEALRKVVISNGPPLAARLLKNFLPLGTTVFPVQPIIRDIWHDHVLFSGDKVTGIVDFGAMQMDNISFDIARLLGSTIGDDPARWITAVEAYNQHRRLSDVEIRLLPLLDQSGILLGSINWLKWIELEQRSFENWPAVWQRVGFLENRLAKSLGDN